MPDILHIQIPQFISKGYPLDMFSRYSLDIVVMFDIQVISRKDMRSRGIFRIDTLDTKDIRDIDVVFKISLNNQNH